MSLEECPHCDADLTNHCNEDYEGAESWHDGCPECKKPIFIEAMRITQFEVFARNTCKAEGCEELDSGRYDLCEKHGREKVDADWKKLNEKWEADDKKRDQEAADAAE